MFQTLMASEQPLKIPLPRIQRSVSLSIPSSPDDVKVERKIQEIKYGKVPQCEEIFSPPARPPTRGSNRKSLLGLPNHF